ncbi:MAG: hypothetical protein A3J62_03400 [Candidatus Buchananbacteria bacterium RIFCSPHIGHO2_02_FULL_38_8]|uniref:AB hydrolase-1 domain-containing protein n=2 Tax=Candidatus Buchananiibacteriota TaxID=1817903 RepID=A0A1G1XU50_9BACT|nr:MAG: hypothetical protein A2731_03485 [Candidatus Buchananbacteria bacterium RIFCSPHIGHO2_01_FULL_39_8]OGY47042.1 MAG: hypothetical protein A3J62_03400 [Candidatus Buchananbacteria bacterium RIFCSPHIGHO2_02_FULL_38_8]
MNGEFQKNPESFTFRQERAVSHLKELGVSTEYAFDIPREVDKDGEPIEAEIFWVRFPSPEDDPEIPSVEGKIYLPKKSSRSELVLFDPGFPGGKAGRFEQNYAKSLIDQGYTFVTLRHNATGIENQPAPTEVFNCEERLAQTSQQGQKYLGPIKEAGYTWPDIVKEPVAALKSIKNLAPKIKLVGHSFGATSFFYSIDRLNRTDPEVVKKISHLVSLAGYIGEEKETEAGIWHGTKQTLDQLVDEEIAAIKEDGVHLNPNPEEIKRGIREVARDLGQIEIPKHIAQVLVYSPEDPVIASPVIKVSNEGGREVVGRYDYPGHTKRTLVIEDQTQEKKFHNLPGLLPQTLNRLLDIHPGRSPHFVTVKEKQPKVKKYERQL